MKRYETAFVSIKLQVLYVDEFLFRSSAVCSGLETASLNGLKINESIVLS
jgi:hypothetical protein